MTAKEFIEKRLGELKSIDKPTEVFKSDKDLEDFIFKTIMSKKFRKFSVGPEIQEKIRTAIKLSMTNNEPIKFALPFGSYKLWRFEESPEADWAELFAMMYYAKCLKPITEVYKPGVWFDFCADDAILEPMNNIPAEDTERYKKTFRDIISFIQPYLPSNFRFSLSSVGERYSSKEEFMLDLDSKIAELKSQKLSPLSDDQIEMMKFNIKPIHGEEIDFENNRILHDAFMSIPKRRAHHKVPEKIVICCTPFGTSLPVGTTKTSVVKIQTGVGVLKKTDDSYQEYIFSPSQLEKSSPVFETISMEGLSGKNFNKIRII
ncbi:MAG: hypothetical protein WCK91_00940 [bacterium]